MDIAMINGVKPAAGSGDGITEYAYNMYVQLKGKNRVDLVYSIDKARKNDILGLLKVNSALSARAKEAGMKDYEVFHVVNQEVGFAARDVKSAGAENRVITTIHDLTRFQAGLQKGALQEIYSRMVRRSVRDAISSSDFLLFDSAQTRDDVKARFGKVSGRVIGLGVDRRFLSKARERRDGGFVVGYIGSFAYHKNAIMTLKAARHLKGSGIRFDIYGVGGEFRNIGEYARSNGLEEVRLMGFADERSKVDIYDSFDAFAFPSLYEGFGLPILEAQARGLPVVIYKHGRISAEVARYCFKAEDEEHMAQIIKGIRDNGYSDALRKKATGYARSFTWEKCAKDTLSVYKKMF